MLTRVRDCNLQSNLSQDCLTPYDLLVMLTCRYEPVLARAECTEAYRALLQRRDITGNDETTSIRDSSLPGLQGCFVDGGGVGKYQISYSQCRYGACDAFVPICKLREISFAVGQGRRSMSYVDADDRILSRVGFYSIKRLISNVPTLKDFTHEPQAASFGGFAPIFLKKIVRSRFDLPSPLEWTGAPPVPKPQMVATHTYCNEDDVERTFGSYTRSIEHETGNEICYSSSMSLAFSLSVEIEASTDTLGPTVESYTNFGYSSLHYSGREACQQKGSITSEAFTFPDVTVPARSVVQYSFSRREYALPLQRPTPSPATKLTMSMSMCSWCAQDYLTRCHNERHRGCNLQ